MKMNNATIEKLIKQYPILIQVRDELNHTGSLLIETAHQHGKMLICGNGGSASDADHIVGELMKSFIKKRPIAPDLKHSLHAVNKQSGREIAEKLQGGIPAIALTQHEAFSTAFSNDVDPYLVFAQQVSVLGDPGDVYWGLSTSGNAKNVVYGAITAKAKGLKVIGMTGVSGGELKQYCDVCICAPETETYKIQELHLPIYHALCILLEDALW